MIDLMALLASPGSAGGPALPGLALGREDAGFDMVLDQVVSQIAALLVPVTPAATPQVVTPALPTFGFAPPHAGDSDASEAANTNLVAPNAGANVVETLTPAPKMLLPTFVAVTTKTPPTSLVTPQPALMGETPDAPVAADAAVDVPMAKVDDNAGPADALVAAIRLGLGLPSTIPTVPPAQPVAPQTVDAKKAPPEQAVAVGRTGVMPTLPEHAHAAVTMPPGIARRFPTQVAPMPQPPTPTAVDAPMDVLMGMPMDAPELAPIVMSTTTPDVAPENVVVPTPVDVAAEPANDIAVPDAPLSGVPIEETPAEGAPVPVPRFDDAPPTELERLSAIAPPTIGSADGATDKNDTPDTLVTAHDDAPATAVGQSASAVSHASHLSRPERPEQAEHVNGLAAPLRAALRDRATARREDGFELNVRLDPPELGVVRVRVFTQGEQVRITLHSDSPEARAVLQNRYEDVKTILANEGFNLDGFDVEAGDSRHQSPEQSNRRRSTTPAPEFVAPSLADDGALRL